MHNVHTRTEFATILERLRSVTLSGFAGYETDKLLYLQVLLYLESNGSKDTLATRVTPFLGDVFAYDTTCSLDSPVLMYCSPRYWARQDMHHIFDNVRQCSDNPNTISGFRSPRVMPSHWSNVLLVSKWKQELDNAGIDRKLANYLLSYIAKAMNFLQFIKNNEQIFSGIKLLITLFDQDYDEYLITEYCKQKSIVTCVLQHGHFAGTNSREDLLSMPFPYENLNADYFVAWGDISKQRAIGCGVDPKRILVAGNPKYLDIDLALSATKAQTRLNRRFILMLDADLYPDQKRSNAEMLRLATLACERMNLMCGVRYHPGHNDPVLEAVVDKHPLLVALSTETPLQDYFDDYDFFICGESSVYAELLLFNQIALRFVQPGGFDKYAEIETGAFSDFETLMTVLSKLENDPESFRSDLSSDSNDLCLKGDMRERYRNLISELVIGDVQVTQSESDCANDVSLSKVNC